MINEYQKIAEEVEIEVKTIKKSINNYSYLRLLIFSLAIFAIYFFFGHGWGAVIIISFFTFCAFLILIKKQAVKQTLLKFKNNQLILLNNELAIINKKENIYDNGECYASPKHPYSDDLDVFGANSLFSYINRTITLEGASFLANWLKVATTKKEILSRQDAANELKELHAETLNFRTRLFPLDKQQVAIVKNFFFSFLPNKLQFLNAKHTKLFIILIPYLSLGLLVAAIIFNGVFWSFLGLGLLISGLGYFFYKKQIDTLHEQISKSVIGLEDYAYNIKWIEEKDWKCDLLQNLKSRINKGYSIGNEIFILSKILTRLNSRLNPIVGVFLNLFFQWDLRCLQQLAKWEAKNQLQIIEAFSVISEFEALISLSTLNYNHPNWVKPIIKENYFLEAKEMGHPLIPTELRINNDFNLQTDITIDVITGSNMAGKSTFLRTLGVNMVLAFAGANVCANNFTTSIFNLISYMRIKDSLANQTSTFKAEIDRLKMIIDFTQVESHSFVLIDEMLRGTNSKDKYLGSKVFIKKLINQKTPGLIATHDLQIAELAEDYPNQLRNFHFDIEINGQEMNFDYKIKNGECKTFNASLLLKAIGIEIDEN